jgi:hypothetical protein
MRLIRAICLVLILSSADGFQSVFFSEAKASDRCLRRAAVAAPELAVAVAAFPAFVPPKVAAIKEPAAIIMLSMLRRVAVPTPGCPSGVPTSYYSRRPLAAAAKSAPSPSNPLGSFLAAALAGLNGAPLFATASKKPAVVLLHGFDSFSVEFRRLVSVALYLHSKSSEKLTTDDSIILSLYFIL